MHFKSSIRIILSLLLLSSCATKDEDPNNLQSYSLIHSSVQISKEAYQRLISQYKEALSTVGIDESIKINTVELRRALDSAKLTNQQCLSMITLAEEIDSSGYKENAIKYIQLTNNIYNNEFEKYITLLGSQTKDRYIKGNVLLISGQSELKKLDDFFLGTSSKIREKYHLPAIDSVE